MPPFKWYHAAVLAGGAVTVGSLLYYLMKQERAESQTPTTKERELKETKKLEIDTATKEDALEVLNQSFLSQEKMREVMKKITQELAENQLSFDEVYARVKSEQPEDPLEANGLSLNDFDELLKRFRKDKDIQAAVAKITGPSPMNYNPKISALNVEKIVAIHEFMLKEMNHVVEELEKRNPESYDGKTAAIAVQAIVRAKIDKEFGLAMDDVEAAVLLHSEALGDSAEFANTCAKMQEAMHALLGGTPKK